MSELFAATSAIDVAYDPPEKSVEVGDYAFFNFTSRARVSSADGSQNEMQTRTTTIAHRGTDGRWRFVVDHNSAP
jgi:ketosteroid isomerase-like protein